MTANSDKNIVSQLIKSIKEDPSLRAELIENLYPQEFVKRDELTEILKEIRLLRLDSNERFEAFDKRFETFDKRFETFDKRFEELLISFEKRFEIQDKKLDIMSISIQRIENKEGPALEQLILGVMEETLKLEDIDAEKIKKEYIVDVDGSIFFPGFTTDIDILVENGNVYLIEVKATASSQDIAHFLQKKKVYELYKERKVKQLILITLRMAKATLGLSTQLQIRTITGSMMD